VIAAEASMLLAARRHCQASAQNLWLVYQDDGT
jgi:hypothetical protein